MAILGFLFVTHAESGCGEEKGKKDREIIDTVVSFHGNGRWGLLFLKSFLTRGMGLCGGFGVGMTDLGQVERK